MISAGANKDWPHGFRPVEGKMRIREYTLAAANSIIGFGDLIVRTNAGLVDRGAADAVQIVGVAMQARAANAGAVATTASILISDHPDTIYEAQVDDDTVDAQTDLFLNYNITVADASGGISQMEIDGNTQNTTATLPIRTIGLFRDPKNALGAQVRLLCQINNHVYGSLGTTGI